MVVTAFTLTGIIIALGFIGNYLFKKTGIPDNLILISLGFVLGPLTHSIDVDALSVIVPYLAALSLLIILFDGGLNLNIFRVMEESPKAMLFGLLGVLSSMGLTAVFTYFLLGWGITYGLLLGAIIGGTSSSVVLSLVTRMDISERVETLLSLESVFTDAIVVVTSIAILKILTAPPSSGQAFIAFQSIASAFSIGAVTGIILGMIWLRALRIIQHESNDDILTLGIALLFYAIVEMLGGNGAIFALTFGLILGNGVEIAKIFRSNVSYEASSLMRKFMSQMSFFVRTYFFVYLGLFLIIENATLLFFGIFISIILLAGRYGIIRLISREDQILKDNQNLVTLMLPRGLAAAIMAQLVSSSNIYNAHMFPDIIIIVIISSVLISSVGSFIISRKKN